MQKQLSPSKHTFVVPFVYKLFLSLLIALYLNTATQYKSLFELLQQQNFYEAVAFSFLLCLGVLYWISLINNYLDRFFPWQQKALIRIVVQLLIGVGLPIFTIYIAVVLYFNALGADMYLSDYLILEFPMVQIMVIALNICYPFIPFFLKMLKPIKKQHLKAMRGSHFFFFEFKDIAYVARENKHGYLISKKAEKYNIEYKMNELKELLPAEQFIEINRSVLVNLDVIEGYRTIKNAQCLLLLNIKVEEEFNFIVTRDRTKKLKEMLKQRKDEALRLSESGMELS